MICSSSAGEFSVVAMARRTVTVRASGSSSSETFAASGMVTRTVASARMREEPLPNPSSLPSWRKSGSPGFCSNRFWASAGETVPVSALWHVWHVRPLPPNVSLSKSRLPSRIRPGGAPDWLAEVITAVTHASAAPRRRAFLIKPSFLAKGLVWRSDTQPPRMTARPAGLLLSCGVYARGFGKAISNRSYCRPCCDPTSRELRKCMPPKMRASAPSRAKSSKLVYARVAPGTVGGVV